LSKILSGKNILITGGTSRLGSAFVRKALEQGAQVFFTYCHASENVSILEKLGAVAYQADLSIQSDLDKLVQSIQQSSVSIHALIHNAAAVRDHTIQNLTEEDWDYVINANLIAPYYLTQKLLPYFSSQSTQNSSKAKVFFIISRVAEKGGYGISNYAAAKAGLVGLTKSLAVQLGEKGILVNAINPGFMKSRMTESLPEQVIQANLEVSPLKQFSKPEEVADFLIYLCSDQMTQASGQVFHFESRTI